MAENRDLLPQAGARPIVIVATVAAVVFFTFLLLGLQSCSLVGVGQPRQSADVVIYSNLDLKDSAAVITRLKELKIPYQIKDEGRSIAVPRGKADDARLGLAEKNLPTGGSVGWEIFDQSKLGATDFDRRIQFIRAISGELSRTINRISAVDDSRVQIVIPETQLFQATTSPVTASVLLTLKPGESLTEGQVNAIVHLVAGSVENLKPQNVTIVDTDGNILTGAPVKQTEAPVVAQPAEQPEEQPTVVEKEKTAVDVQAKLDLEDSLTSRVQALLNRMYPPNITIARVTINSVSSRKTSVIILVDKNFKLSPSLKNSTFATVAAAISYDKNRGDTITLRSVPFRSTGPVPATVTPVQERNRAWGKIIQAAKAVYRRTGKYSAIAIIGLPILVLIIIIAMLPRGGARQMPEAAPAPVQESAAAEEAETAEAGIPVVEQIRGLAAQRPDQAARIIRSWLTGEGG